jgi:hypothetical protein
LKSGHQYVSLSRRQEKHGSIKIIKLDQECPG